MKEAEALIERGQAERLRGEEGMRLLSWDRGGELNRTVRRGRAQGVAQREDLNAGGPGKPGLWVSTAVPWAGLAGVDGTQAWPL